MTLGRGTGQAEGQPAPRPKAGGSDGVLPGHLQSLWDAVCPRLSQPQRPGPAGTGQGPGRGTGRVALGPTVLHLWDPKSHARAWERRGTVRPIVVAPHIRRAGLAPPQRVPGELRLCRCPGGRGRLLMGPRGLPSVTPTSGVSGSGPRRLPGCRAHCWWVDTVSPPGRLTEPSPPPALHRLRRDEQREAAEAPGHFQSLWAAVPSAWTRCCCGGVAPAPRLRAGPS